MCYNVWFSCSAAAAKVRQLEGPSDDDLSQSSGVQSDEVMMTASPPSATGIMIVFLVLNPCTDTALFSL